MILQELFGIELPIIQAPMAGVQGAALAVAVSNAGGLGSLPCATLSLDAMRSELATIRAQTSKPFNVNFFCHTRRRRTLNARRHGGRSLRRITGSSALMRRAFPLGQDVRPSAPKPPICSANSNRPS